MPNKCLKWIQNMRMMTVYYSFGIIQFFPLFYQHEFYKDNWVHFLGSLRFSSAIILCLFYFLSYFPFLENEYIFSFSFVKSYTFQISMIHYNDIRLPTLKMINLIFTTISNILDTVRYKYWLEYLYSQIHHVPSYLWNIICNHDVANYRNFKQPLIIL